MELKSISKGRLNLKSTLEQIFEDAKTSKIGFVAGAFDLLHPGHQLMLQEAKNQCDILVVALQSDPGIDRTSKNSPVQGMFGRYISLQGNKYVDYVLPYSTEEDLYNMLQILPINIRILDEEYKYKEFTGSDLEIEVYFNKRKHNYSSSRLRKDVHCKEKEKTEKHTK